MVAESSALMERAAARTELAQAGIEEARRRQEAAIAKQDEAVAKQNEAVVDQDEAVAEHKKVIAEHEKVAAEQKAITAKLDKQRAESNARWQEERIAIREQGERHEKFMQEHALETKAIISELKEHRDERRALLEAIFRVMDRLDQQQPPPPNLRSV